MDLSFIYEYCYVVNNQPEVMLLQINKLARLLGCLYTLAFETEVVHSCKLIYHLLDNQFRFTKARHHPEAETLLNIVSSLVIVIVLDLVHAKEDVNELYVMLAEE